MTDPDYTLIALAVLVALAVGLAVRQVLLVVVRARRAVSASKQDRDLCRRLHP